MVDSEWKNKARNFFLYSPCRNLNGNVASESRRQSEDILLCCETKNPEKLETLPLYQRDVMPKRVAYMVGVVTRTKG